MSGMKRTSRLGTTMALAAGLACAAGAQAPRTNEPQGTAAEMKPAAWQATEPTVKDDLFAGTEKFAKNASDVTEVTMDPDMLDMVSGSGAKRAHNMVLNVVRTYSYDKPGMYRMEDVDEFRRKLNTGDWHCSVHTRDLKSGESTDICNRRRTDGLVESAIVTVEPKELTFIHTIKKPGPNDGHGGRSGESMLFAPEIPGLSGWSPEMQAKFAAMGPLMEAKFAAMGPVMEAKFAAMGPAMQAKFATMNRSRQPALPTLNEELQQEQMEQRQKQMERRHEQMQQRQEQMEEQQKHLHELQTPQP